MSGDKRAAIGAIIGAFCAYFAIAFAQWDANPAHWSINLRQGAAVAMFVAAAMGALIGAAGAKHPA